MDLSEKRLCEVRCFGANDDMSNWAPKPKFMLAEGDIYLSFLSEGINLALFDPRKALCNRVPQFGVNRVSIDAAPI